MVHDSLLSCESTAQRDLILEAVCQFRPAGFALHYLHPRSKRPIGESWSTAPVATLEQLCAPGDALRNLGVRLGEPSALAGGGYLHLIDIDIRVPELADEAWQRFRELIGREPAHFPSVISGSGGASRHLYFVCEKPFASRKIARSAGKHGDANGRWHWDWEIELFGTGKQAVFPGSIHPDTGLRYRWEREFDLDLLPMGLGPALPASLLHELAPAADETFAFENIAPVELAEGEFERALNGLPVERLDDYDDWRTIGQAIHHQTAGSEAGFEMWDRISRRSERYEDNPRKMRQKWRSFGKYRGRPVTMLTLIKWSNAARREAQDAEWFDAFEPLPDLLANANSDLDIDALIGSPTPAASTADDFAAFDIPPDDNDRTWIARLDKNPDSGAIRPTLFNVELIVRNDTRVGGLPQLNLFTQEVVQRRQPGTAKPTRLCDAPLQLDGPIWRVRDATNGDLWNDGRDAEVRRMIEAPRRHGGYSLKVSDRDLREAIIMTADRNRFHPVQEFLSSLKWDNRQRAESLFIRYFGAPDDPYTRAAARILLVGAVARIFEPGHKLDSAIILEGSQGTGKSTFVRILGRDWSGELEGSFDDRKGLVEAMQGKWILEMAELKGFSRAEVTSLKAFLTCQADTVRLAYARRAETFPRQSVLIGTTNDSSYLRDDTGGRRFLPIRCEVPEIDLAHFRANIDQIWAEAVIIYRAMRDQRPHGDLPLYLIGEERSIATEMQESRRVETAEDTLTGRIEAWLNRPVPTDEFAGEPTRLREITCLAEIFDHCIKQRADERYTGREAQLLGRAMNNVRGWRKTGRKATFDNYGEQRLYIRDAAALAA